jgi:tRNA pseudouridine38-40 synthase
MERVALKFAYDGKKFAGYARQPNYLTVEGELIKALIKIKAVKDPRLAQFQSASRTDKGVSALGNVCAFNTDFSSDALCGAINSKLKDIWAWGKVRVASDFSPRWAISRTYIYFLPKNNLNLEPMEAATTNFVGEHDFRNFSKVEKGRRTQRKLNLLKIEGVDNFIRFTFTAQNFLWNQVRK